MKLPTSLLVSILAAFLLTTGVTRASPPVAGEELAVIQAMVAIVSRDAQRPFDFLYFESEFPAQDYVNSALSNPDRTSFCGLTREQAQFVVSELSKISSEPLEFSKTAAKPAGLSIGHKRLERFRYLTLSRVVFAPDRQHAWLVADLNGESGAIFRLEKKDGDWHKAARCGGWMKTG
jgi:hypothetical protein